MNIVHVLIIVSNSLLLFLSSADGQTEIALEVCGEMATFCECEIGGDKEKVNVLKCVNVQFGDQTGLETTNLIVMKKDFKVQRADFNQNVITRLRKGMILPGQERNLIELNFEHNSIHHLDNGTFDGMEHLTVLLLGHNRIYNLRPAVFASSGTMWQLHKLHLNNNRLSRLVDGVFDSLLELEELVLDGNPLFNISAKLFGPNLHKLTRLSLDSCNLTLIEDGAFDQLISLEELSLRDNPLVSMPSAVMNINTLVLLDMSHTHLSKLDKDTFKNELQLKSIFMQDMPNLRLIEDCAFCALPQLKELNMKNSRFLSKIDENAFGSVNTQSKNLSRVDFEYCNLSVIPEGLFISWRQLSIVRLGGNPLHCDCSIMWMQKEINLTQGETKPACASPKPVKDRPLDIVRSWEMCPYRFDYVHLFILFAMLSITVLGLAMWNLLVKKRFQSFFCCFSSTPEFPYVDYNKLPAKEEDEKRLREEEKELAVI